MIVADYHEPGALLLLVGAGLKPARFPGGMPLVDYSSMPMRACVPPST